MIKESTKNLFDYGTDERLTKRKKISKSYDEQYFDLHREDDLVTNDML